MSSSEAIILYVHGARDSRWAEPFLRLRERVAARAPQHIVEIAFLDHMSPDLVTVVRQLSAQGVARIRIVPMFFGRSGHLRTTFPDSSTPRAPPRRASRSRLPKQQGRAMPFSRHWLHLRWTRPLHRNDVKQCRQTIE